MERGARAVFAAIWRRREPELSRRDIPSIGMTGFWIIGILMLLSLGAGLLVGTSWNIHALDYRYRSLAAERRELDEWSRALHQASQHPRATSSPLTREAHRRAATRTDRTLQDSMGYAS